MDVLSPSHGEFNHYWQVLFQADAIQSSLLNSVYYEYYQSYHVGEEFKNLSHLFLYEGVPLFATRMTYLEESRNLSYFAEPAQSISDFKLMKLLSKKMKKNIRQNFAELLQAYPAHVEYQDNLASGSINIISQFLLAQGACCHPRYYQVIDLNNDEEYLWKNLRKSYKSLIRWGEKNLRIELINQNNLQAGQVEAFRQLHIAVSKRETRSQESWHIQQRMIKNNSAFMVRALLDGALVSCALFTHSDKNCYYAVSAANREMFDKPLSHAVVWRGIQVSKQLGCLYFDLGEQVFNPQQLPGYGENETDKSALTKKEQSISLFKRGFGGELRPRLYLRL